MKKSNKLILAGFLTVVLFIAAIHITLYAKYRSGNYVPFTDDLQSMIMQAHPHVKFVSIRNVENVAIEFGDSLQTEKTTDKDLTFSQKGDTLHISGADTASESGAWNDVRLQLPHHMPVVALNSTLYFSGKGTAGTTVFPLLLNNSKARFSNEANLLQLGAVKVTAINNSNAEFQNSRVGLLTVSLQNSSIDDIASTIDSLTIHTDAASQISLQSKHLIKAKINTLPPNP